MRIVSPIDDSRKASKYARLSIPSTLLPASTIWPKRVARALRKPLVFRKCSSGLTKLPTPTN